MEINNSKIIVINDTIIKRPSVNGDIPMMFAGHLLIVFYCLIFILGFLGM
jgi:hypothetical protein